MGILLHSYMRIIVINHYKDPYWLMLPMTRPLTHGCLESILQVKKIPDDLLDRWYISLVKGRVDKVFRKKTP